jgi:ATP-dependent DNA ligase
LQNFRTAETRVHYSAFDILVHRGRHLIDRPLVERRTILEKALPLNDHISLSVVDHGSGAKILKFVKQHGLEDVIAKRSRSVYGPGKRTGARSKHRFNLGQEFAVVDIRQKRRDSIR